MSKAPIDLLMDTVNWTQREGNPPSDGLYATHEGVVDIGGFKLKVYRLNDGRAVIDAEDMDAFFGGLST